MRRKTRWWWWVFEGRAANFGQGGRAAAGCYWHFFWFGGDREMLLQGSFEGVLVLFL